MRCFALYESANSREALTTAQFQDSFTIKEIFIHCNKVNKVQRAFPYFEASFVNSTDKIRIVMLSVQSLLKASLVGQDLIPNSKFLFIFRDTLNVFDSNALLNKSFHVIN